jgi:hypothetical protein
MGNMTNVWFKYLLVTRLITMKWATTCDCKICNVTIATEEKMLQFLWPLSHVDRFTFRWYYSGRLYNSECSIFTDYAWCYQIPISLKVEECRILTTSYLEMSNENIRIFDPTFLIPVNQTWALPFEPYKIKCAKLIDICKQDIMDNQYIQQEIDQE